MFPHLKSFAKKFMNIEKGHYWFQDENYQDKSTVFRASAGQAPAKIAVNEVEDIIYVSNFESQDVSVLNGSTGELVRTLQLPENGVDLAVNPENNLLYISNPLQNSVTIMDSLTGAICSSVKVGYFPTQIVINRISAIAYVVNLIGNSISALDRSHRVVYEVALGGTPSGIAIDEVNRLMFVGNRHKPLISVFSLSQIKKTPKRLGEIEVSSNPLHLSVNPVDGHLYVLLSGQDGIAIFNTSTRQQLSQHPLKFSVTDGLVLHSESLVIHINQGSNIYVTNLSTGLVQNTISTENTPISISVNHKTGMAFFVCAKSDSITFIKPEIRCITHTS